VGDGSTNGHLAYGGSPLARLALFCGGQALVFFSLPNSHLFPAPISDASQPQKKAIVTVASIGYSWVEWKWRAGIHVLPGLLPPPCPEDVCCTRPHFA
jgi:hypothetical protein